jgi:hypothetical protein
MSNNLLEKNLINESRSKLKHTFENKLEQHKMEKNEKKNHFKEKNSN